MLLWIGYEDKASIGTLRLTGPWDFLQINMRVTDET